MGPNLRDLVTVLYRPRETIRRILDAGGDRWTIQIVLLAFLCASVGDVDIDRIPREFPGVEPLPLIAVVAFVLVLSAAAWLVALFVLSWIATFVGHGLGGTGTVADVRTALAWGMVPFIWSLVYRIPLAIFKSRIPLPSHGHVRETIAQVASHGGCVLIVLFMALQLLFEAWCFVVAACNLAEAQRFSTAKGFGNLAITLAVPVLIIFAALFAFGR